MGEIYLVVLFNAISHESGSEGWRAMQGKMQAWPDGM